MEDTGFAKLIYLSVLVTVILGSILISRKGEFWKLTRQAGVWLLIFVALVAAVAGWQDIRRTGPLSLVQSEEEGKIIIPKQRDGHFHLKLDVNGTSIDFLVDTGASGIVLNQQDAQSLGFDLDTLEYWAYANTANGKVRLAPVRLGSITLGGYKDKNVKATVNEGDMRTSLLGMSYLKSFSGIEIKQDQMILTR
mgnify:CR=1 FL=1